MTRQEHVEIETILKNTYLQVANQDMSDINSLCDRQSYTASKFRNLASEKILAMSGLSFDDISEEYKAVSLNRGRPCGEACNLGLKALRVGTGLTQKDFADKFHIPVGTLQGWEQGKREMPSYVAYMMKQILEQENK